MKTLTLYDFLRVGHVKRWHNVNTVKEQTLAEHSYMVTIIAIHLASAIVGDEEFTADVAFAALFHDAPEVVMGDTPTPAKRFIREFTKDDRIFDKMEAELMPKVPYRSGVAIGSEAMRYVKMADKIEAAHWVGENGVGKHADIVKAYNWRNVEDYVELLDNEHPASGWYEAVNSVLMALGMRYVYKQARITPP